MSTGSSVSCSARTCVATVSGLLPQNGACKRTNAYPAALLARHQANAHVTALLARLVLLPAPAVVVGHPQRLVKHGLVVAAVVDVARRDLVRDLIGLDEGLPPDVDEIGRATS